MVYNGFAFKIMGEYKIMKLEELKKNIQENKVSDDLIIFVCPENNFLANEYANAIVKLKGGNKRIIKDLNDTQTATAFIFAESLDLAKPVNILRVDKFETKAEDYSIYKDTIVICSSIDKNVKEAAKEYVLEMPKLEDWQVIDYIKAVCPGIKDEADWLYCVCNKDIYKIANECAKINIFAEDKQKEILTELKNQEDSDLFEDDFFKFTEALLMKDTSIVYDFLKHRKYCDLEPVAIVNTLIKNLSKILTICFSPEEKIKEAGFTNSKQVYAIRYKYKNLPLGRIMYGIDEMSIIDSKLKTGKLDLDGSKEDMLSYVVGRMMM